jgi:hypothetical protein
MKTKWRIASLLTALVAVTTSCAQEQGDPIDIYFYATENAETENWTLFVDGNEIGPLPYREEAPPCNNASELGAMLLVTLPQGRHTYEVKDAQGVVEGDGWFKIKEKEDLQSMRLSSGPNESPSGATAQWTCDYITIGIFN